MPLTAPSTAPLGVLTAFAAPLGVLTASSGPGAAALGLLDEKGGQLLDEAGGFILGEDGS